LMDGGAVPCQIVAQSSGSCDLSDVSIETYNMV